MVPPLRPAAPGLPDRRAGAPAARAGTVPFGLTRRTVATMTAPAAPRSGWRGLRRWARSRAYGPGRPRERARVLRRTTRNRLTEATIPCDAGPGRSERRETD